MTVCFWAEEAPVRCFFSLLDILHNGSRVTYNGTFGLFDVFASDLTAVAYIIRCQVARIWKPPVVVLRVCIQMTLTPIFVRRAVRRLAL